MNENLDFLEEIDILLEENQWDEIIDLMNGLENHIGKQVAKNFQIPQPLYKLIDEDLRTIKDKEDKHYAMMKYMICGLMHAFNIGYNQKNNTYYRKRNNKNLNNYYAQKKEEIG